MTSRQHDPHVREAILALYSKGQQDGAPAHTANMAQEWCQNNFRAIENGRFWPKSYWPPCSPDLNVMDFAIWGMLAQKACSVCHNNLDSLKRSLQTSWDEISPEIIRASCLNATKRLEAVVEAEGGYIEKKLVFWNCKEHI